MNKQIILYWLASILFTFHFCAIASTVLPTNSALYAVVHKPFEPYLALTGTWQSWKMFHSIPYDQSYCVQIRIVDSDGREQSCGFTLPALTSDMRSLRLYKLYSSFNNEYYQFYREPYLRNLRPVIMKRYPNARLYHVRMTSQQMRSLREMRESGEASTSKDEEFGPYSLK